MSPLEQIHNFLPFDANLATSGQPDASQLQAIADAGYEVVINLGLPDAPYAVAGERAILEGRGVRYEAIPVSFEAPEPERFSDFRTRYRQLAGRRCFIHCAANKRVSAFMALYRILELGWSREAAEAQMHRIWRPDPAWRDFIERVLASR